MELILLITLIKARMLEQHGGNGYSMIGHMFVIYFIIGNAQSYIICYINASDFIKYWRPKLQYRRRLRFVMSAWSVAELFDKHDLALQLLCGVHNTDGRMDGRIERMDGDYLWDPLFFRKARPHISEFNVRIVAAIFAKQGVMGYENTLFTFNRRPHPARLMQIPFMVVYIGTVNHSRAEYSREKHRDIYPFHINPRRWNVADCWNILCEKISIPISLCG